MVNPNRFTKVKYRAPYSDHWEERPLDWAMERIAHLVKRTRDETFVPELPNGPTVNHTMAVASLEDFKDASQVDGLFSGWEEDRRAYEYSTWQYEGHVIPASLSEHYVNTGESYAEKVKRLTEGPPQVDMTLEHPNCVYQIMRRHYAAYTPEMVERVTGCPKETFLAVAEALTRNSGPDRTAGWCYAVGWTHHTTGVQMIRSAAIVQALLGNIGRPGGGILALRGHCSIQGSTDIPISCLTNAIVR